MSETVDRIPAGPGPDDWGLLAGLPQALPLDVRIPSDVRYIEGVVGVVARTCAALSFPPRAVNLQVPVALTEALSNAILYGNGADATKRVTQARRVSRYSLA